MEASIDKAGRVVIPKALRDALGLRPGSRLEIHEVDGQLLLREKGPGTTVRRRDGRPVLEADDEVDVLTAHDVRDLLERGRR